MILCSLPRDWSVRRERVCLTEINNLTTIGTNDASINEKITSPFGFRTSYVFPPRTNGFYFLPKESNYSERSGGVREGRFSPDLNPRRAPWRRRVEGWSFRGSDSRPYGNEISSHISRMDTEWPKLASRCRGMLPARTTMTYG